MLEIVTPKTCLKWLSNLQTTFRMRGFFTHGEAATATRAKRWGASECEIIPELSDATLASSAASDFDIGALSGSGPMHSLMQPSAACSEVASSQYCRKVNAKITAYEIQARDAPEKHKGKEITPSRQDRQRVGKFKGARLKLKAASRHSTDNCIHTWPRIHRATRATSEDSMSAKRWYSLFSTVGRSSGKPSTISLQSTVYDACNTTTT